MLGYITVVVWLGWMIRNTDSENLKFEIFPGSDSLGLELCSLSFFVPWGRLRNALQEQLCHTCKHSLIMLCGAMGFHLSERSHRFFPCRCQCCLASHMAFFFFKYKFIWIYPYLTITILKIIIAVSFP
jgi:hypothetical protein